MANKTKTEVLDEIIKDAEKDVKELEGKPFTGRNVSTMFGYQAAAIAALAKILKSIVKEQ